MSDGDSACLKQAKEFWHGGKSLEAGRLLFERLPSEVHPGWAARILRLVLAKYGILDSFEANWFKHVLDDAEHQALWGDGRRFVAPARESVLWFQQLREERELSEEERRFYRADCLAELVAKVTYNAAGPRDPFDEDAGWLVAVNLRETVEEEWPEDREFCEAAWAALCHEELPSQSG